MDINIDIIERQALFLRYPVNPKYSIPNPIENSVITKNIKIGIDINRYYSLNMKNKMNMKNN